MSDLFLLLQHPCLTATATLYAAPKQAQEETAVSKVIFILIIKIQNTAPIIIHVVILNTKLLSPFVIMSFYFLPYTPD
jgi:hypothetical protein